MRKGVRRTHDLVLRANTQPAKPGPCPVVSDVMENYGDLDAARPEQK
jgi:hypothetical protein